jgi:hypothetical protein
LLTPLLLAHLLLLLPVLQDSGLKLDPVSQLLLLGPMAALALAVVASIAEWTDDTFTFADLPWYHTRPS